MTVDAIHCYEPVAREADLDRFNVVDARTSGLPGTFWDNLHQVVQLILVNLEESARQHDPGVQVHVARTRGTNFFLFTYRTFEPTDETIEPVVAGLTFTANGNNILVHADISGEQSGDLIATLPNKIVPPLAAAVTKAARELATELSHHGRQLATALFDPARKLH
jgi:hypothetical protein